MASTAPKLKRTQISLAEDELQTVRRLARERRTSMSRVIRAAIRREMQEEAEVTASLMSIVAIIEGDGRSSSENPDDQIYG